MNVFRYCLIKKQNYNEHLDIDKITDKTFWKIKNPLFSNKSYSTNFRSTLCEKQDILSEEASCYYL